MPSPPAYKCLFFDLDHTLWDFEKNAEESLKDLHNKHALDQRNIGAEDFVKIYSNINKSMWRLYHMGEIDKEFLRTQRFIQTFLHFGIPEALIPGNLWDEYLALLPQRTNLMPGCIEILDYLHPKYPMTIITNGFKEVQHEKMYNSLLTPYFKHVVISETIGHQKPAKEIFLHALELNNVEAHEVLMIGDNIEADIQGAKNAGIPNVYFNPFDEPDTVGADFMIKDLRELKMIL
jgi:putative hydrolase of the HAD superfamily